MSEANRKSAIEKHMALQPPSARLLEVHSLTHLWCPNEMLILSIESPNAKGELLKADHTIFVEK